MRRFRVWFGVLIIFFGMTGCGKRASNHMEQPLTPRPTVAATKVLPKPTVTKPAAVSHLTVEDYYPVLENTEYVYEGIGNEYAGFRLFMDYYNQGRKRYQIRKDNGATTMAEVMQIRDGRLSKVISKGEAYYNENLLEAKADSKGEEILLMEPFKTGTSWILPDKRKRYISNVDVKITTPTGNYRTIEVKTQDRDSVQKDYYARGVGLVKTITLGQGYEVSATLSKIKTNVAFVRKIDFYYPGVDEKIYAKQKTLTFHTNDDPVHILQEALKKKPDNKNYLPLVSRNTRLNSIFLGDDNIVHVDFSKEFVEEMNLGSGYESLVLQCIANTLGEYYGVQKVLPTIDHKNYESGHIVLEKGETWDVDMESVVR
jgi:hypothetical protein